jgi:hypothetical protein
MFEELFKRWPSPLAMSRAGRSLENFVRPLGLWRRRAALLRRLSAEWRPGLDPSSVHGVGRYALDAHAIFVDGRRDVRPADGFLSKYLTWEKRRWRRGRGRAVR